MSSDPRFEVNDDGTAKDPVAFRQALREDKEKLKIIEVCPLEFSPIECPSWAFSGFSNTNRSPQKR